MNNPKMKELLHRLSWNIYQKQHQRECEAATQYFLKFDTDRDPCLLTLNKERLYYRKIKEGNGEILKREDIPLLNYQIRLRNGEVVFDKVDLKRAIRGFKEGLVGRKIGEKGILYIHPEWGYQDFFMTPYADKLLEVNFEVMGLIE
ncbi:macrophage infectivity potentiator [Parachlamydia acanthamoebae UV-7]|jgi:FKBP-type peptidyl-prolyl cis-trans isomerase|uniref:peptidylprolyl isomerase n=2 Tax=Parachlamydia acanthamoebae TaxID=83552 RepID=F8L1M3_PARAV|nr:FKBP-type peptidyl-prolyl cis-trans isomerase [Parachlamydia acanthamoebae]CCB87169.1 macrophage infectivity potentiator [Parachlamydia acanthamoebae UV-7]